MKKIGQTEYLDAIISVKLVDGVNKLLLVILINILLNHTDSIITENEETAETIFYQMLIALLL